MVDRFMTGFIKTGGMLIIVAVFAIFLFIFREILPLFKGAHVEAREERVGVSTPALAFGIDEWGELPFVVSNDGSVTLLTAEGKPDIHPLPLVNGERAMCATYEQRTQHVLIGTSAGRILRVALNYSSAPTETGSASATASRLVVSAKPAVVAEFPAGVAGQPVLAVGFADGSDGQLLAMIQEVAGKRSLYAVACTTTRTMMGTTTIEERWRRDLTALLPGPPLRLLVDDKASALIIADQAGRVTALAVDADGAHVNQPPFRPFADLPEARIASMNWMLGDVSLVFTAPSGQNRIWSLYIDPTAQKRQYGQTKVLPDLQGGADAYASSLRNKAFLLADGTQLSLRYGTSGTVRWEGNLPYPVTAVTISSKFNRICALDDRGNAHVFTLDDPHPEAGLQAYFGKVWYEGADKPEYVWQTGTEDTEPKLSLIPLIIGTLKGTLFAMLFATPIALLAAIYTSEFMHTRFKSIVKPTIEIMASLPSVVLGFIAALWLAERIEHRVPAVLCMFAALPIAAMVVGWGWTRMPDRIRSRIRPGYEFLAFVPVMLLAAFCGWQLGQPIEALCFGGNFTTWWPKISGATFDQRNALVVGFAMGFAVIPILFTIIEDALSNVPPTLRSGSLALGASRWQTALLVVVPTASAGILSAIMIGLGRAVGETMIVVMASGNTAVMDILNPFDGMRTLSANIATEMPEAPAGGTLYRTLFLGAMLLFLLTFVINTCAEVLRQHLREKYKTV